MTDDSISISASISELDEQSALDQVRTRIGRGDDPEAVLIECREGLDEIGKRFESGEYFIADLVYAASIFEGIMGILGPELKGTTGDRQKTGKVAIATVKDDIHDIGKNLVASMLDAAGFEVIDLGVDVSGSAVCDCIREQGPDIVALSCLLTSTLDSMEDIIAETSRAGLRDRVRVIVGGIPLTPGLAIAIGADAYGDNATEAVTRCRDLMERAAR